MSHHVLVEPISAESGTVPPPGTAKAGTLDAAGIAGEIKRLGSSTNGLSDAERQPG
jgi:hypothetical protein